MNGEVSWDDLGDALEFSRIQSLEETESISSSSASLSSRNNRRRHRTNGERYDGTRMPTIYAANAGSFVDRNYHNGDNGVGGGPDWDELGEELANAMQVSMADSNGSLGIGANGTSRTNPDGSWNCSACTYLNENPLHLVCAVCGNPKGADQGARHGNNNSHRSNELRFSEQEPYDDGRHYNESSSDMYHGEASPQPDAYRGGKREYPRDNGRRYSAGADSMGEIGEDDSYERPYSNSRRNGEREFSVSFTSQGSGNYNRRRSSESYQPKSSGRTKFNRSSSYERESIDDSFGDFDERELQFDRRRKSERHVSSGSASVNSSTSSHRRRGGSRYDRDRDRDRRDRDRDYRSSGRHRHSSRGGRGSKRNHSRDHDYDDDDSYSRSDNSKDYDSGSDYSDLSDDESRDRDDKSRDSRRSRHSRHRGDRKERGDRPQRFKAMKVPKGEVTIIYTDVQGSTSLWEADPLAMKKATDIHDKIVRKCYHDHGGYEITTEGDAFNLAFQHPADAIGFALKTQLALYRAKWPAGILNHPDGCDNDKKKFRGFRVRFGMHHGPTTSSLHDTTGRTVYAGEAVSIAKGIEKMSHGGQILTTVDTWRTVSGMAEQFLGSPQVMDCGEHLLFDPKKTDLLKGKAAKKRIFSKRIVQLVPNSLCYDFFAARGGQEVVEGQPPPRVCGRVFPPLLSHGQLSTSFLNAPYNNNHVAMVFVYTDKMEAVSDKDRKKNFKILSKYVRSHLMRLSPPGYECQEDNGSWMLAFDRIENGIKFGLDLKEDVQKKAVLCGDDLDKSTLFRVGIHWGPFLSMGPHTVSGHADYFGPIGELGWFYECSRGECFNIVVLFQSIGQHELPHSVNRAKSVLVYRWAMAKNHPTPDHPLRLMS